MSRWLLAAAATAVAANTAQAPGGIPAQQLFSLHEVRDAGSRGAICNDGSPARFWYRNCSANWDSHGTDFCNVTDVLWLVVFETSASNWSFTSQSTVSAAQQDASASGAYCYDEQSCVARSAVLKTSTGLNESTFAPGIVIPYAEANPNLYKSPAVIVPYCSSDLWAGNGSAKFSRNVTMHFRGAAIVDAVIEDLVSNTQLPGPSITQANSILIIGPSAVVGRLDELASMVQPPSSQRPLEEQSEVQVFGMCDGCLLVDVPLPSPALLLPAAGGCTSDADCPPARALPLAWSLWGLDGAGSGGAIGAPAWCGPGDAPAWTCLLANRSLARLATLAAIHPVLVQLQQFDAVQLASYGQDPASEWAEVVFAPAVRSMLADARAANANMSFAFSAACAAPAGPLALSDAFYQLTVNATDLYNHSHADALVAAVPMFLECARRIAGAPNPCMWGSFVDGCGRLGCGGGAAGACRD